MTFVNLWEEAERIAKFVHLDKVGEGQYIAQLNRQRCICDCCSVECKGASPEAALREAIAKLSGRPLHEPQEGRKEW